MPNCKPGRLKSRHNSSNAGDFSVEVASWLEYRRELESLRRRIFIEEQHVPEALEWDGLDDTAQHFLARDANGAAIGCARLLAHGKVGRMAVLPEWRRFGVGSALLHAALAACRLCGERAATLSAQVTAIPFYEKAGFRAYGDIYLDAGIPHRNMILTLSD